MINDPPNDPIDHDSIDNDLPWQCETSFHLSLREVTSVFGISKETLIEMLDEGVMTGESNTSYEWMFDHEAVQRISTALRLHRDLGVNFAGASLALELLKEIERLETLISAYPDHR